MGTYISGRIKSPEDSQGRIVEGKSLIYYGGPVSIASDFSSRDTNHSISRFNLSKPNHVLPPE